MADPICRQGRAGHILYTPLACRQLLVESGHARRTRRPSGWPGPAGPAPGGRARQRAFATADSTGGVRAAVSGTAVDRYPAARGARPRAGGEVGPAGTCPAGRRWLDHARPGRPPGPVGADPARPRAAGRGRGPDLLVRPGESAVGRALAGADGERAGEPAAAAPPAADQADLGWLWQPGARRLAQPAAGPGSGG